MVVTAIVGLGTDTDLFVAIPLGVFAGALATLFVALSDGMAGAPIKARRQNYR